VGQTKAFPFQKPKKGGKTVGGRIFFNYYLGLAEEGGVIFFKAPQKGAIKGFKKQGPRAPTVERARENF